MFVSELMKYETASVAPGTTLADAARIMITQHISGLPVVEDERLVGVITEGDLMCRIEIGTDEKKRSWIKTFFLPGSVAGDYVRTHGRFVRDVMTTPAISVSPDTALADAANLMCDHHIKRLPVVWSDKLVGVISRSDLLCSLARHLVQTNDPFSEVDIRRHILATLDSENWAPKTGITIKVADGVVDLDGVVISDNQRRAIRVIAETTPGVNQVRDHLVFVDPTSGISIPVA
jgi:CBS domain-containing protein